MKPTIGRIVHYVHRGEDLPAIITHVEEDERVSLVVFSAYHPHGTIPFFIVPHSELENHDNTWHWPETRVEEVVRG